MKAFIVFIVSILLITVAIAANMKTIYEKMPSGIKDDQSVSVIVEESPGNYVLKNSKYTKDSENYSIEYINKLQDYGLESGKIPSGTLVSEAYKVGKNKIVFKKRDLMFGGDINSKEMQDVFYKISVNTSCQDKGFFNFIKAGGSVEFILYDYYEKNKEVFRNEVFENDCNSSL